MRDWILDRIEDYDPNVIMPLSVRGAIIGRLEKVIGKVADELHLPPAHGVTRQKRAIRLDLASYIFDREVTTFNDLHDWELWAISRWVNETQADGLRDWMRETYGEQIPLC